jgi:hypothetical protein
VSHTKRLQDHYQRRKIFTTHAPDPRHTRECPQQKIGFDTKRIAQEDAGAVLRRGGPQLYPYRCPYCKLWHLTKQVQ